MLFESDAIIINNFDLDILELVISLTKYAKPFNSNKTVILISTIMTWVNTPLKEVFNL